MPRPPRFDTPGRIYHVMNRGAAHRTLFEGRADFRFFLSRVAHAVRRGEIVVLAYCLLPNHFHLVVRSHGGLSEAMRRIQGEYTQRFNRSRDRDGALQRGRFGSKAVMCEVHLGNLFPYVDANPVDAGLTKSPAAWPWGSAGGRAAGRHRAWLSDEFAPWSFFDPDARTREARAAFIESKLREREQQNEFINVVQDSPAHITRWMQRRARLADGTEPGALIVGVESVLRSVQSLVPAGDKIRVPGARQHAMRELMQAGLYRDLAGCSFETVASRMLTSPSRAKRLCTYHMRCVADSREYAELAAEVVGMCVEPLAAYRSRRTGV